MSSDLLIQIAKWIVGPIVGAVITLLVREPLRERLAPLVARLGAKSPKGVGGRWVATLYHHSSPEPHTQVIELALMAGTIVGRIVPHALNSGAAKRAEDERPLRVTGSIREERYFVGVWQHPDRESHHHGAFHLVIRQNHREMEGLGLSFSEDANDIVASRWVWRRLSREGAAHG